MRMVLFFVGGAVGHVFGLGDWHGEEKEQSLEKNVKKKRQNVLVTRPGKNAVLWRARKENWGQRNYTYMLQVVVLPAHL